jgi:hypothetical protein
VSVHNPVRPAWMCGGCGDPWPCATRRQQLLAEYDGAAVSLSLYMTALFVDAVRDQPHLPAGELFARFLGWLRPPR